MDPALKAKVDALVHEHPVVVDNRYTRWFATGAADPEDVRHLTVQFSVFSHLFIEAQLRKVINAPTLEAYHSGKEILMNELGVSFSGRADTDGVAGDGTVEGSRFKFSAAHFEWLLRFAAPLGLGFEDLGKRRHGTPSTLHFCDALFRIYGSEDPSEAEGASYAVEHWAAAGFWKELIAGLTAFRAAWREDLPLGFWTWHDRVEDQHAAHTAAELEAVCAEPWFEPDVFLRAGAEMLDAVKVFWDGLEADRLARRSAA